MAKRRFQTNETKSQKQRRFLVAFAQTGNVTFSAKEAGIDRTTHYSRWMKEPRYATRFNDAKEQAADVLEGEALRRAVQGIEEPVFYRGERIDTIKRYSDILLIFLLKAVRPEKFRDRYDQGKAQEGIPVSVVQNIVRDAERKTSTNKRKIQLSEKG